MLVISDDITAEYILKLIGDRAKEDGGRRSINDQSLRLILEKIQELSDLGDGETAQRLRAFAEDIKGGRIPSALTVDEAHVSWTAQKVAEEIHVFAAKWIADEKPLKNPLTPTTSPILTVSRFETSSSARLTLTWPCARETMP